MIDQAYVGFVYECGGLEGVALSLPAHVAPREPVQFGIDERVQLVECGLISFAPFGEELGNLMLPGYTCQLLCHAYLDFSVQPLCSLCQVFLTTENTENTEVHREEFRLGHHHYYA